MQQLSKDLKGIPGVIGLTVYHPNHGAELIDLPTMFAPERIDSIGQLLDKALAAGRLNFPGMSEMMLSYEEAAIVCRQMHDERLLSVFCDPGVNLNLLIMSMNLALQSQLKQVSSRAETQTQPQETSHLPQTNPSQVDTDAIMNHGPLSREFKTMITLLTKVIGPMAKILFDDAFQTWAASGPTDSSNLRRLVDLVGKELNDPEKAKQYREMVRSFLSEVA